MVKYKPLYELELGANLKTKVFTLTLICNIYYPGFAILRGVRYKLSELYQSPRELEIRGKLG